jgi:hypothetical protein
MEISGKIVLVLNEQSGNGKNGVWRKKEYVLETPGNYPKKICFVVWNEKIDQFSLQQGENVQVGVEIESREYNGKWYTDIKAWKVDKGGAATSKTASKPAANAATTGNLNDFSDVTTFSDHSDDDVLPF